MCVVTMNVSDNEPGELLDESTEHILLREGSSDPLVCQ